MNFTYFIGIDVSKDSLQWALANLQAEIIDECQTQNDASEVHSIVNEWIRVHKIAFGNCLFCLEPTGPYSHQVKQTLLSLEAHLWEASPLSIHLSKGLVRGKSDPLDAQQIAIYALRYRDQVRLVAPGNTTIDSLGHLFGLRELLVEDRGKYRQRLGELSVNWDPQVATILREGHQLIITQIEAQINSIETNIDQLVAQDPELNHQFQLLQSIEGIGPILALSLIVVTRGFTRFKNPRKLACYAGVVPFEYSSGRQVSSRRKISHRANKKLKKKLHMAALAAIRSRGELERYYHRKTEEGKPKMAVLNAVRNKLIHRVYAIIKRGTPYVKILD